MVTKPKISFIHQPNLYSRKRKLIQLTWGRGSKKIDLSTAIDLFSQNLSHHPVKIDSRQYRLVSGHDDFRIEWAVLVILALKKLQIDCGQGYLQRRGLLIELPYSRFLPLTIGQIVEIGQLAAKGKLSQKDFRESIRKIIKAFRQEKDLIGINEFYRRVEKAKIPYYFLSSRKLEGKNNYQIGQGIKASRMIGAGLPSNVSLLRLSRDKTSFKNFAEKHGLPVPKGGVAKTEKDLEAIAKKIGFPLIIKPITGSLGKGVSPKIDNSRELNAAFRKTKRGLLVEQYIKGRDYRILCIGGKVKAVAEREPASIVGNGQDTVKQLMELENRCRKVYRLKPYRKSSKILKEQGLSWQAVPKKGQKVFLRYNANLSTGGRAIDQTDRIHPMIKSKTEKLVQDLGARLAGVDLITRDISQPLDRASSFIEINSSPGIAMHYAPDKGRSRDITEEIIKTVNPKKDFRIVNIAVYQQPRLAEELADYLPEGSGVVSKKYTGTKVYRCQREILIDRKIKLAVYDLDQRIVKEEGLYCDRYDLLIISQRDLNQGGLVVRLLTSLADKKLIEIDPKRVWTEIKRQLDN